MTNFLSDFKGALSGPTQFLITEKCFLFHLKHSFPSQDTYIFVFTFWSCRKTT